MITVTLIQRGLGLPFGVDEHPAYMDFELRDDPKTSMSSIVDVAEENAIAPLIARINGCTANDTYPELIKAHERLLAKHKDREDGLRLITMLLSWAIRWPQGIWEITGPHLDVIRDRGDWAGIDATQDAPRFSTGSITTTNAKARLVGVFDAQSEPLESVIMRPEREPSTEELMQPDFEIQRGGHSSSGRVRRDRQASAAERNQQRANELREDGLRPMMASGRVSIEAHSALYGLHDQHGERVAPGQMMEILGLAIASGRTYEEIVQSLGMDKAS